MWRVYGHSQVDSDLLVQRAIGGVNHCGFTTAEYEAAFADLVAWAEEGIKPEGDVVGDTAEVPTLRRSLSCRVDKVMASHRSNGRLDGPIRRIHRHLRP